MAPIMEAIRAIRNGRAEYDVEPSRQIAATVVAGPRRNLLTANADIFVRLARIDPAKLHVESSLDVKPTKALAIVVSGYEVYLPLADLVDIDRERERLARELDRLQQDIARSERLLANTGFVSKAPPAVVDKERAKLADARQRLHKLSERLTSLEP
jgi:valyl-tRNA synthetase